MQRCVHYAHFYKESVGLETSSWFNGCIVLVVCVFLLLFVLKAVIVVACRVYRILVEPFCRAFCQLFRVSLIAH